MIKKDVVILGIHDGHNASAAVIKNGKVLAAVSEERLNNIKNYSGVPKESIKKVLEISQTSISSIQTIAVSNYTRSNPHIETDGNILHELASYITPWMHQKWFINLNLKLLTILRKKKGLNDFLSEMGIDKLPIKFVEHHLAHASTAYYSRPWDDKTLVLTLDAFGDSVSSTVNVGDNFEITRIAETSFYDSLAVVYSEVTAFLGLKRWEHEYKVMGMAPYGKAEYTIDIFRKLVRINPHHPLQFQNTSGHYLKGMQRLFKRKLAGQRFDNVSAGIQQLFEELVLEWVKNSLKETGLKKIACAGGAFLNVKANKLIRELPEVEDLFIYPASDDSGSSVGAALEVYYRYCDEHKIVAVKEPIKNVYYGQEFTDEYIEKFIKSKGLSTKARKVTPVEVARELANGKIIARFAGRDEWGPRSLGNRSIMADPRNMDVIRKINFAIKQRDFWMPFAPAILEEDHQRYLKNPHFSPYMTEAFDTTEEALSLIAGLHPYDLTARPQTVNSWNPGWQSIIREFKKITGVGSILNTSFNLHGYPVCGTPEIAYSTFENSDLDGLLLNNWLIKK